MENNKLLPISIIILAFALIFSSNIIAKGIKESGQNISSGVASVGPFINNLNAQNATNSPSSSNVTKETSSEKAQDHNDNIYYLSSAADYLGIDEAVLLKIVKDKKSKIPFIETDDDYIFYGNALDKWMETAQIHVK